MIKNSLMKFIDSCVGNIARKIEDEFRESDHPRDKGGKFTYKGGEGRGGGKQEKSSSREASSSSSGGLSKGQRELASHVFNAITTEAIGQNDFDSIKEARDYVRGYIEMMLDDSEGLAENYGISEKEAVAAIKHANKSWKSSAQYKDPWESSYEDPYEESEGSEEDDDYDGGNKGQGEKEDPKHEASVEETDDIMQRVSDTGIDVEEFMADLGINTSRIPEDRLEETLSEELYADPNLRDKALKKLKNYAGEGDDNLYANDKYATALQGIQESVYDDPDSVLTKLDRYFEESGAYDHPSKLSSSQMDAFLTLVDDLENSGNRKLKQVANNVRLYVEKYGKAQGRRPATRKALAEELRNYARSAAQNEETHE